MEGEIPSTKSQIPNKHQAPNSKQTVWCLEFGAWNLFDAWDLEFCV
jgi:hypothetical protein